MDAQGLVSELEVLGMRISIVGRRFFFTNPEGGGGPV